MLDESLVQWRRERLRELRQLPDFGSQAALAKALGLADGSYIGQMERGRRAITEKLIAEIEQLRAGKYRGWFAQAAPLPLSSRAVEIARLFDLIEPRLQVQIEALVHALQPISAPAPAPEPTTPRSGDRKTLA